MDDKPEEKKVRKWIDRNLWSIPAATFLLLELTFSVWAAASLKPVLLAALPTTTRLAFYTSLTATSGTLFAIAVAVVTILVAFAPRDTDTGRAARAERDQARARTIVVGSWLATSFFMLMVLITATIAQAVDLRRVGNNAVTTLIESSAIAGVVGLLLGGVGLALVIVERSRQ